MEHDMTEQAKLEPIDGEVWYVKDKISGDIGIAIFSKYQIKSLIYKSTSWNNGHDYFPFDFGIPIAPVARHELMAELVAALDDLECDASTVDATASLNTSIHNARKALAKAKLAGLGK